MRFLIREKGSKFYFAEPGCGTCRRQNAFVYDTDQFSFQKCGNELHLLDKADNYSATYMVPRVHVIIPVGDL